MFFKRKMLPVHKKAVGFRELVNIHPEMRGKTRGISFFKIDKTGLAAAGTTLAALEEVHERREKDDECRKMTSFAFSAATSFFLHPSSLLISIL